MRVEQNADGTYRKGLTPVEQRVIKMIYKEQNDRADENSKTQAQLDQILKEMLQMNATINTLTIKINGLQSAVQKQKDEISVLQDQVASLSNKVTGV